MAYLYTISYVMAGEYEMFEDYSITMVSDKYYTPSQFKNMCKDILSEYLKTPGYHNDSQAAAYLERGLGRYGFKDVYTSAKITVQVRELIDEIEERRPPSLYKARPPSFGRPPKQMFRLK